MKHIEEMLDFFIQKSILLSRGGRNKKPSK